MRLSFGKILRTTEAHSDFTGPYIKTSVLDLIGDLTDLTYDKNRQTDRFVDIHSSQGSKNYFYWLTDCYTDVQTEHQGP